MKKEKIKLYHFSNQNITGELLPKYYGQNSYTSNDKKFCNIQRIFFYLEPNPQEHFFKNSTYLYIAELGRKKLYDLRLDKLNLIDKNRGINLLLNEIKKLGYKGVIYETGGLHIANTFEKTKAQKKRQFKNQKNGGQNEKQKHSRNFFTK